MVLLLLAAGHQHWKMRLLQKLQSNDGLLMRAGIFCGRENLMISSLDLLGGHLQKLLFSRVLPIVGLEFNNQLVVLVLHIDHIVYLPEGPLANLLFENKPLLEKCFFGLHLLPLLH